MSIDDRPLSYAELDAARPTLTELLAGLRDGRGFVRANALLGLAANGHTGPDLVVFLRDGDDQVARAAAEALRHLGLVQRTHIVAIATALDGARPEVVELVEHLLSELVGSADAELLDALDTVESFASSAVIRGCKRAGGRGLDLLQKAARDERTRVRINAARGIAQLGDIDPEKSLRLLFALANDDSVSDVRTAAKRSYVTLTASSRSADTVRITREQPRVPALTQHELDATALAAAAKIAPLEELLHALHDPRTHARLNALRVLAQQGASAPTARDVASLLRDAEAVVRVEAARALRKLGAVAAAAELVRALGDAETAAAAEETLADAGVDVAEALVEGLDVANEAHGARVAALIARLPDGVGRLTAALASPAIDLRVNAALALTTLGPSRAGSAVPSLIAAARYGSNARLRAALICAISVLDPRPTQAPPVIPITGFEIQFLDESALPKDVLVKIGAGGIARHLADVRPIVRANAATALAVIGGDVTSALAACLRDDAPEVREAAVRAIEKLEDPAIAACAPALVDALADAVLAKQIGALLARKSSAIDHALVRGLDTDDRELADRLCELIIVRSNVVELLTTAWSRTGSRANAAHCMIALGKDHGVLQAARASNEQAERDLARATLRTIAGPPTTPAVPEVMGFETTLLEPAAFTGKLDTAQFVPFLRDGRPVVRANAVTALGDHAGAATLAALLRDDDVRVRVAAARAIGKLGDDEVSATAPALVAALRGEPEVAAACKTVLAARQDKVEAALLAGLETDDERHGIRVAELVCALPRARELLFAAFDGEAQNVQINAAFGIAMLGDGAGPAGRQRLVGGLAGPFNRRRSAMEKALSMMRR